MPPSGGKADLPLPGVAQSLALWARIFTKPYVEFIIFFTLQYICVIHISSSNLTGWTIRNVSKKLNEINPKISLSHQKPFPNLNFLSNYRFKKRFVKILSNGDIQGGYTKMITSLIDFSFIRSLVAHCYSEYAPPVMTHQACSYWTCFDTSTVTKIWANSLNCFVTMSGAVFIVPTPASWTIFPVKAPSPFSEHDWAKIFHVLVDIFHQLEMITFSILAHDGTCTLPGHDIKAAPIFVISAAVSA